MPGLWVLLLQVGAGEVPPSLQDPDFGPFPVFREEVLVPLVVLSVLPGEDLRGDGDHPASKLQLDPDPDDRLPRANHPFQEDEVGALERF
ncbi:hypothetical protein AKJ65_07165 [candidate division MSBL1 archaeon SCGC-AAA259E19]|uniref:Uncharacterized protein n=1 Tax=candidate division MSBL1 archaeon SCGC-AAA259E19 TaxID=1698264 RepID=A0A133UEW6_9EURY|nr:hypothetical protein AKJ65_07165 [candidate division MSBL1 archaeon SCGC-AAA259E19]